MHCHGGACPRRAMITTSQFALSTLPHVSPKDVVQQIKGRLYYCVRDRKPKPFKGNFAIRSVGSVTRQVTENYVADQLGLGAPFESSPLEVALCFLNNLAFVHEMKPIYQFGGYVGTAGEYTNKAY